MSTVRNTTKTTVTLVVFAVVLAVLHRLSIRLDDGFFFVMERLLQSKRGYGGFLRFVVSSSFWLMLVASGLEMIFHEKAGFSVLGSFFMPILFSLIIAIWGLVGMSNVINTVWFWLFYHVVLLVFCGIAKDKVRKLKEEATLNASAANSLDRVVLGLLNGLMLADLVLILISGVILYIRFKEHL